MSPKPANRDHDLPLSVCEKQAEYAVRGIAEHWIVEHSKLRQEPVC